jgi:hypothetical protein
MGSLRARSEAPPQPAAEPIPLPSAPSVTAPQVPTSVIAAQPPLPTVETSAPAPRASAKAPPSVRPTKSKNVATSGTSGRADDGRSCNPPYYDDAQGIRHIKPECLKFE